MVKNSNKIQSVYFDNVQDYDTIAVFSENREIISLKNFEALENSILNEGLKMPITLIPLTNENNHDIGTWDEKGHFIPWNKSVKPKYALVDGQNRSHVLKKNGLCGEDYPFQINNLLTRDDIKLLNNMASSWGLYDYLHNNGQKLGGEHQHFFNLVNKYYHEQGFRITAVAQTLCDNNKDYKELVKNGQNTLSELGPKVLDYAFTLKPYLKKQFSYGKLLETFFMIFSTRKINILKYFKKGLSIMSDKQLNGLNFNQNKIEDRLRLIELINGTGKEYIQHKGDQRTAKGKLKELMFELHDNRCSNCGVHSGMVPCDIHHIEAFTHQGKTIPSNLEPLCRSCHTGKTSNFKKREIVGKRVKYIHS